MTMRGRAPPSARLGMNSLYIRLPAALLKVAATNLVPSGAISALDIGVRPTGPGMPNPERSFMAPKGARPLSCLAGVPCVDGPLSFSSTTLAFSSIVGGSSLAGSTGTAFPLVAAGPPSPRSIRWSSAVASTSWPARVRRVASRTMSGFSIGSPRSVGESGLDCGAGMKGSEHRDRGNCGACQLRRDVLVDGRQAEDVDVQHLAVAPRPLEIDAGIVTQPQVQTFTDRRLLDHLRVPLELVADRRPDEIGAVRIKPFLHHEIDLAEVHIAQVDRDLLRIRGPGSQFAYIVGQRVHPF